MTSRSTTLRPAAPRRAAWWILLCAFAAFLGSGSVRAFAQAPSAPTVQSITPGNTQIQLSWSSVSGAVTYNLYRSTSSGMETSYQTGVTSTSFLDTGLSNGVMYYYQVTAASAGGNASVPSAEAAAKPLSSLPAAPPSLTAAPGNAKVTLTWTLTSTASSYTIYRGATPGGEGATPVATNQSGPTYTDSSVTNGTTYYYVVSGVSAAGAGPSSSEASALPLATAPATAPSLTAGAGYLQAFLSWSAVPGTSSYTIYRGTTSGGETQLVSGISGTSYTDTVASATTYYYKVAAVNAAGPGPLSNEAAAALAGVPAAPANLTATPGNAQVALSWTAPPTGPTPTGYTVYYNTNVFDYPYWSQASTTVAGTSTVVTGLANGQLYNFWVTSVNGSVQSQASPQAVATPQALPAAPGGLTAIPGNASVSLSWIPVSAATSYNLYRSSGAGGSGKETLDKSGLPNDKAAFTDTGLSNGTQYFYEVTAVTAGGEGPKSNEASATPQTVPAAPSGLTATPGNARVTLSWGSAAGASSYNIYRSSGPSGSGNETLLAANVSGTSYTDSSVSNGVVYYYKVAGVGPGGAGPPSSEASATPLGLPAAPSGLTATPGNAQVSLTWNAVSGSSVTYNVYRSSGASGSGSETLYKSGVSGTSYTDASVSNSVTYYYEVTAIIAGEEGTRSSQASAQPTGEAAAPLLSASLSGSAVLLSWTPIPGASSYNVYRGTSSGGEGAAAINASPIAGTSYTDTGLTSGTQYFYMVKAVNAGGLGLPSNEVSATVGQTVPSSPVLTAAPGSAQVSLAWTAVGGATGYVLYRSSGPGASGHEVPYVIGLSSGQSSFVDTGLTNGTAYDYKVGAVGAWGTAVSNEATATPLTPGPALTALAGNGQVFLSWSAVPGATYNLYRATASGQEGTNPSAAYKIGLNTLAYLDTAVTNGTNYFYKITAVTNGVESAQSAEAGPAQPAAPLTPAIVPGSGNVATGSVVTVSLSDPATGAALSYTVNGGASQPYTGSFQVTVSSAATTIVATATLSGGTASATAVYTPIAAPTVVLAASSATSTAPGAFLLTATASTPVSGDSIAFVDFYSGGTRIGSGILSGGSYTFTWNSVPIGSYTLTARAADADGVIGTSSPITVAVVPQSNPLPQMSLTAQGSSMGFGLSLFASNFPYAVPGSWAIPGIGPTGIAFTNNGVEISSYLGILYLFPSDTDGQNAPPAAFGSTSSIIGSMSGEGSTWYAPEQFTANGGPGDIRPLTSTGTLGPVVTSAVPEPSYLIANPATGHLWVSTADNMGIWDVDPVSGAATIWKNNLGHPQGLATTSDGSILYIANIAPTGSAIPGDITGYNTSTGAVVYDYNTQNNITSPTQTGVVASPDGIAMLSGGALNGQLLISTDDGRAYLVNPGGGLAAQIASGGTRGQFVGIDPNGTLLLVQTDRVLRLTPPAGSVVGPCAPAPLASLALSPQVVTESQTATGTITLAGPALTGGEAVALSSSSGAVQVPFSVLVPAGQTSATFLVTTSAVPTSTSAIISASYHGGAVRTVSLVVNPASSGIGGGTGGGTGGNGSVSQLSLTPTGIAEGFDLSIFAAGFPWSGYSSSTGVGPTSCAVLNNGNVLVSSFNTADGGGYEGEPIYIFPSDTDGQNAANAQLASSDAFSLATDGNNIFAGYAGSINQLSNQTSPTAQYPVLRTLVTGTALGIALNPITGHVYGGDGVNYSSTIYDIDPSTTPPTVTSFNTVSLISPGVYTPGAYNDGMTVSPDGKTLYVTNYFGDEDILGFNVVPGSPAYGHQVFDSGEVPGDADGIAAGAGSLAGKIYANTNDGTITNNGGTVIEIDTTQTEPDPNNPGQTRAKETLIASGGTRGDLASIDQTNNTFLLSQTDRIIRLIPPPGGGFGRFTGSAIYTRDDLPHGSPLTHAYPAFGVTVAQPAADPQPAAFDLSGLAGGHVSVALIQRAGQVAFTGNGHFDAQLGVASLDSAGSSYGSLVPSLDALGSPYAYTSSSWMLPQAFDTEIQSSLGGAYQLALTDQISSLCGSITVSDTPHAQWPQAKNILSVVAAPTGGLPQIDPKRCLDIVTDNSSALPALQYTGYWEILLNNQTIATSGNPNGWNVEPDHTSLGGATVTVPAGAVPSDAYQLNVVGAQLQSGDFAVTSPGMQGTAAILLPLTLPQAVVAGSAATLTISLDTPAPPGGATVTLTPAGPITLSVPIVTIPEFATSATVAVTAQNPGTGPVQATVMASYNGYRVATAAVLPSGSATSGTLSGGAGSGGGAGTPTAPLNLAATASNGQVRLTWAPPASGGTTGYIIWRATTKGGPYVPIFVGLPASLTSFTDNTVSNGSTYYYVVTAENSYGFGGVSNEASATPLAGVTLTPTIAAGSAPGAGGVYGSPLVVTLSDATPGAVIYYTLDGSAPTTASVSQFNVQGSITLASGTTPVRAIAVAPGDSPSAAVSATFVVQPPAAPIVTPLVCGQSLTSYLGSATSQTFGPSFHAGYYGVAGSAGDVKTITVTSNAFDTVLVVRDPSGNVVASDNEASPPISGATWASSVTITLADSGTYTVEVTSFVPGITGSQAAYAISLTCQATAAGTPQLSVKLGATVINNGDTPGVNAALSYGATPTGVPVIKTFTLANTGNAPLTISQVATPGGFTLLSNLTSPLAAGQSEPLTLRFDAGGSASGAVSLTTNDPRYATATPAAPFQFTVSGTASGGSASQPQVPQGGSTAFLLTFAVSGLPSGTWYIQDPSGAIDGSSDSAYGGPNGWNVSLGADGQTVTVTAPATATVQSGYIVYVPAATPDDAALFAVVAHAAPPAPTNLTATAGNAQVQLSWSASLNATSYTLYRSSGLSGSGQETLYKSGLAGTTYTDTGLTNDTTYYYKVAAVDGAGASALSNEASALPDALAAPNLTAAGGNAQVSLSWSSVSGATSYGVYRGTYSGGEGASPIATVTSGTSYTDTGLTNGTYYYYKVKAFGASGATGPYSNEAQATPSTLAAPTLSLSGAPGNGQVTLTWTSVAGATYYYVYYATSPGSPSSFQYYSYTQGTTLTVSGLTNGATYYFAVQAWSGSAGSFSNTVSAIPNAVPSAPVSLKAMPGNAIVALTWTAPSGSAAGIAYNIYRGTSAGGEGATPINSSPLAGTTYTDTGLANGTAYYYKVVAVDSAGASASSNEASATPQAVTAAPIGLAATAGNAQATLTWSAPAGNPAPTGYNLYRAPNGGTLTKVQSGLPTTPTKFVDTGLTNGVTYVYAVTAVDAAGESQPSNQAAATPQAPPSAPSGLTATAGLTSAGQLQVVLQWTPPASGPAPSGYAVYKGTASGGETALANAVTTTYVDAAVTAGKTYDYYVKAVTVGGSSGPSNEASATPQLATASVPVITAVDGLGRPIPSGGVFVLTAGQQGTVTIQSATPGAAIGYSTAVPPASPGPPSAPSSASPVTLPLTGSITVSAVAGASGYQTSAAATATFILDTLPTVALTSPAGGATFHTGDAIPLAATAADSGGSVTSVQFLATQSDGRTTYLVGSASGAPFQAVWANVPNGSYTLTAVATDANGGQTTSAPVGITVTTAIQVGTVSCTQGVAGTLSTSDAGTTLNLPGGTHYAQQFTFSATAGEAVAVSLSSSAFDATLGVYGPASGTGPGPLLGTASAPSRSAAAVLTFSAAASGTYTAEVTTAAAGQTGDFALALDCLTGSPALMVTDMTPAGSGTLPSGGGGSVALGSVPPGTPVRCTVTFTNSGSAALTFGTLTLNADSTFSVVSVPAGPVAPNASATLVLQYLNPSATDTSTHTATVSLATNAVNPYTLTLTATGGGVSSPAVQSVSFSPSSIAGGGTSAMTVALSGGSAPAGGLTVYLASSNPALLPVPSTISIPAGSSAYTLPVTAADTAASAAVTVKASLAAGGSGPSGTLTVAPSTLKSLAISPAAVTGGSTQTITATVTLSSPAPTGGQSVTLTSSNPGVAWPGAANSAPVTSASSTVAAGASSTTVAIQTSPVTAAGTVTFTASVPNNAVTRSAALTVNPNQANYAPPTVYLNMVGSTSEPAPPATPTAVSASAGSDLNLSAIAAAAPVANLTIQSVSFYETPSGGTAALIGAATLSGGQWIVTWHNPSAGTYALTAVATDSEGGQATSSSVPLTLTALPPAATPAIAPPAGVYAGWVHDASGNGVTLTDTNNNANNASIYYTLDGSSPVPGNADTVLYTQPLILTQSATVTAAAAAPGNALSAPVSAAYTVVAGNGPVPTVQFTGPQPPSGQDAILATQPTTVTGTVSCGVSYRWEIDERAVAGAGTDAANPAPWIPLASGTGSGTTGTSATFDPTLLRNGQYELRLSAITLQGQAASPALLSARVQGGQKVGYFTLSYNDLTLPVAGLPIQITRTYDSRDAAQGVGVFGAGWTLQTSNVKIQKSDALGQDWQEIQSGFNYEITETHPHLITVTLPDDTVYNFVAAPNPDAQFGYPIDETTGAEIDFQALPGTNATLTAAQFGQPMDTTVYPDETDGPLNLLSFDTGEVFDTNEFILTLRDGRQLDVDAVNGLNWISDANGNRITFNRSGSQLASITSSAGRSTQFAYSGSYISSIQDANNGKLAYTQNGGNLTAFTDRAGNTTTYGYDARHYLTTIQNPNGTVPLRNYYDSQGRLSYSLDAHNNKVTYAFSPGGATTVDARGFATTLTYDSYGNVTTTQRQWWDPVAGNATASPTLTTTDTFNPSDPNNPSKKLSAQSPLGYGTSNPITYKSVYTYDAQGDLLTVTDPLGNKIVTTYDGGGRPLTITDALGNTVATKTYDANGNLTASRDALGNVTNLAYNANGTLASTQDALGHLSRLSYDAFGDVTSATDALGHSTAFAYDSNGNKIRQTTMRTNAATGQTETLITQFVYDPDDRLVRTVAPDGSTTQTVYNSIGKVDHTIDAAGRTTAYTYDETARLIQTTYADGTTAKTQYDASGNVILSIDQAGRATATTYDSLSRAVQSGPVNPSQPFTATSDGHTGYVPNWLTDGQGHTLYTTTVYDANGRAIEETDALGDNSATFYDQDGRTVRTADALTVAAYRSSNGNSLAATYSFLAGDASIFTERTSYDADGRAIDETDANGNTTTFRYDLAGQQVQTINPDGTTIQTQYDALGRRTAATDPAGQTTAFAYDALGRLTSVTTPSGHTEQYTYDELGEKTAQQDANGHVTAFVYDVQGRLVLKTRPLGDHVSMAYNPDGTLEAMTNGRGIITTYTYDPLTGNLLSKTSSNGEAVATAYNPDGTNKSATRTTLSGQHLATSWAYYPSGDYRQGLLQSVTDPNGRTITYSYDALGRKASTHTPSMAAGANLLYAYDADGRLSTLTHPDGAMTRYGYDAAGNRTALVRPNGVATAYAYDDRNRLVSLSNRTAANQVISSYRYTLRADGVRLAVTDNAGTVTAYGYDADDKLTSETYTGGTFNGMSIAYTYDPVGNRLSKQVSGSPGSGLAPPNGATTSSYDADDQLHTISGPAGSQTLSYDGDGEQTTLDSGATCAYDAQGHLVSTTLSGATIAYAYDADGNRISAGATSYLVDTQDAYPSVAEEYSGTALAARYDYGDDLVRMDRGASPVPSYYLFDGLGSTRQLTSSAGAVTDTYAYDAFGNLLAQTGSTVNPYLFDGQEQDAGTGLYYLRARYMNPQDGRFISQDPYEGDSEDPTSLHRYLYASNQPTNLDDPGGEDDIAELSVSEGIAEQIRSLKTDTDLNVLQYTQDILQNGPVSAIHDFQLSIAFAGVAGLLATTTSKVIDALPALKNLGKELFSSESIEALSTRVGTLDSELDEFKKGYAELTGLTNFKTKTFASLKIEGTDQTIFGINKGGKPLISGSKFSGFAEVSNNDQVLAHAEGDVFLQAEVTFGDQSIGKNALLYIDNDPCNQCGSDNGIRELGAQLGLKQLTVVYKSRFANTAGQYFTRVINY